MTQMADEFWFLASRIRVAVAQDSNTDRISVLVHDAAFGEAPPLHIHYGEDEIFHVLDGELEFELDGVIRLARAGETLCAPRGVPHRFRVVSREGARFLTVTRGGFEGLVRDIGKRPQGSGRPAPFTPGPGEQSVLAAACFANGINIIGPPLGSGLIKSEPEDDGCCDAYA